RPGACVGACARFGYCARFDAQAGFRSGNRTGAFIGLRFDGRAGFRTRVCFGSGSSAGHRHAVIARALVCNIDARIGLGAIERIACAGYSQPGCIVHAVRRERTRRELTARPYRRARPHAAPRDGTQPLSYHSLKSFPPIRLCAGRR
ncbi:TPA: hypothetical protein ACUNF5_003946, partial [Burkholderia orbicola]